MTLRILQVNAQRSLSVTQELRKSVEDNKIDILILQEPYLYEKQVKGYASMSARIVQNYDIMDSKAAIIVYNNNITVTQLEQFKTEHIVCAHLKFYKESFYIVSVYCQFSFEIEKFLAELDVIINKLGEKEAINSGRL